MQEVNESLGKFRISPRQELAILLLLQGLSVEKTAEKLKITPRAIFKWLKNEAFKTRLEEERERITRASFEKLEVFISEAVNGLSELMHSENESIRLKACLEVVFFCRERVREKQIVERLDKLTEELGQCQETIGGRRY